MFDSLRTLYLRFQQLLCFCSFTFVHFQQRGSCLLTSLSPFLLSSLHASEASYTSAASLCLPAPDAVCRARSIDISSVGSAWQTRASGPKTATGDRRCRQVAGTLSPQPNITRGGRRRGVDSIMEHDLILFDTKPIHGVIVSQVRPLPPHSVKARGQWRELAVSSCSEGEDTAQPITSPP